MQALPRPTRARIGLAIVTAVTATLLFCQVLAVNAAEPVPPPPDKSAPRKEEPKPEAQNRHKKLKKVMPVKDFGDY